MSILIEIWNRRYQQIQIVQLEELLSGPVIKYIHKEKQRNKVLFDSKSSSVHSCMSLIPTFNHFVHIVEYVK